MVQLAGRVRPCGRRQHDKPRMPWTCWKRRLLTPWSGIERGVLDRVPCPCAPIVRGRSGSSRSTPRSARSSATSSSRARATDHRPPDRLWLEYALLVFPGQHLTQHEQDEFARRFGDLEFTATPLTNIQPDGTLRANEHDLSKSCAATSDGTTTAPTCPSRRRARCSSGDRPGRWRRHRLRRHARRVRRARRRHPERIAGLAAHHSRRYSMDRADLHVSDENADRYQLYGYGIDIEPPLRPLVKVHPDTGRRNLLIGQHTHTISRHPGRRVRGPARSAQRQGVHSPTHLLPHVDMRGCGAVGQPVPHAPGDAPRSRTTPTDVAHPGFTPATRRPKAGLDRLGRE